MAENEYIKKAWEFYELAQKEIEESKENGKLNLAVDGCDKGWLSINLASKGLFLKKGVEKNQMPKTYRGMNFFMNRYADINMKRTFSDVRNVLHIDGFWDQYIDYDRISRVFDDIKDYIKTIETM